jgi:hypothetical protein
MGVNVTLSVDPRTAIDVGTLMELDVKEARWISALVSVFSLPRSMVTVGVPAFHPTHLASDVEVDAYRPSVNSVLPVSGTEGVGDTVYGRPAATFVVAICTCKSDTEAVNGTVIGDVLSAAAIEPTAVATSPAVA